jgi:hypothetical protein
MCQKGHPLADLRQLSPAASAVPQMVFDLLRLWLRKLPGDMSRKLPRNMPCEHR